MKKQFLFCFFFSLATLAFGQNCGRSTMNNTAQINGARANFGVGGFLQYTPSSNATLVPYYKNAQSPSTIFSTNFWFVGTSGSTPKLSVDFYDNRRFFSGPIVDLTRAVNPATCEKWDKFWTLRRIDIETHRRDFADNGRIDNPIPSIMSWPAVGNPNSLLINGFALPARPNSRGYAPFVDVNRDGIYNPTQGDYPAISANGGSTPDFITWCVVNDLAARVPLNIEIQTTNYGYECDDTAQVFNNTIFSSYKIIHHGATDLDSFKIALYSDFDLGCYTDDYVGCDSSLNTFFVYNKNPNIDGTTGNVCDQNVSTFKASIPVQAITFLNQPMSKFRVFYSSAVGNVNPATTDPSVTADYFNYLDAKWKDGKPITSGGTGYNAVGTATNYMFPSDPYDSSATAWSMARTPIFNNFDMRSIGISDIGKLKAGETKTLDMAFSAHRRVGRNGWQNVATMREEVAQIRQFYQNYQSNPLTPTPCTRADLCLGTDCVWAGDANRDGISNYRDLLPIGVAQTQTGALRIGNNVWSPRTVTNWNTTFSDGNFNVKHIDCNGDGVVELADFDVTIDNRQLTKPDFQRPNDVYTEGSNLSMTFDRDLDNLLSLPQKNYDFTATVSVAPTLDLYGLAFEIEYDPYFLQFVGRALTVMQNNAPPALAQLIDSSKTNANKAQLEFSRLGFSFQGNNNAPLLKFKMGVNETNFNWPTNVTFIKFKNIKGIKRDGTIIPLGGLKQRVRFADILIDNKEISAAKITLFPNPATNETTVNWGKMAIKKLQLSNAMGQILMEKSVPESAESDVLNLQNFPTGVYFLQIQTIENKSAVRKLILTR